MSSVLLSVYSLPSRHGGTENFEFYGVRSSESLWHQSPITLRVHSPMMNIEPTESQLLMCESCGVVRSVHNMANEMVPHSKEQHGECGECGCKEFSQVILWFSFAQYRATPSRYCVHRHEFLPDIESRRLLEIWWDWFVALRWLCRIDESFTVIRYLMKFHMLGFGAMYHILLAWVNLAAVVRVPGSNF